MTKIYRLSFALLVLLAFAGPAQAAPDCSNYSDTSLMSWPAVDPVWEFCWRRAEDSAPQPDGSGLELFEVSYNGHLVFDRTHVPILNVEYGPGGCGCFRDWLDRDRVFEAVGSPCSNGYCEATQEPQTICDCAPTDTCDTNPNNACNVDIGNFTGVASYKQPETLKLTTQTSAGWYRYTMEWEFHLDGTIEPRFGFGATPNGCTNVSHFHHGYYRFDFDIDGPANDQMYTSDATPSGNDTDGDSVDDTFDNCQLLANADQTDADDDGFGNLCDADFNNDNVVNVVDLGEMRVKFFSTDPVVDLNSDGVVNASDLGILRTQFFSAPGPAGSGASLTAIDDEVGAYSTPGLNWQVQDTVTGRGYRIVPGSGDHKLQADSFDPTNFASGDYWILSQHANEIDDGINFGGGCSAQLDDFVGTEGVSNTDLVFWYRFGSHHIGQDECFCGRLGPRLVPIGDWSRDP